MTMSDVVNYCLCVFSYNKSIRDAMRILSLYNTIAVINFYLIYKRLPNRTATWWSA